MSASIQSSPIVRWHHRILGVLWALCGLVELGNVLSHAAWDNYQSGIKLFVVASYVVTGLGFTFGCTWARRTMGVLMAIAMILILDAMLLFAVHGNRQAIWAMLGALGFAGYTILFLGLSSFYRPEDSK